MSEPDPSAPQSEPSDLGSFTRIQADLSARIRDGIALFRDPLAGPFSLVTAEAI